MESAMTSKERIINALLRKPVDYVPCSPLYNALNVKQREKYHYQFPWAESQDGAIEYNATVLGVDPTVSVSIPFRIDKQVQVHTWIEHSILHKTYETPDGPLHASVRYDELWPYQNDIPLYSDYISHFVEPWLKTEEDISRLEHLIYPPRLPEEINALKERYHRALETANRYNLAVISDVGMGMTGGLQLMGAEAICLAVIDNPHLIAMYLEIEHKANMQAIDLAMSFGADIIVRNGFYETADLYGAHTLRQFLKNNLQEEFDLIHQAGGVAAYTLNTGLMPILDYIDELNFDCVYKMEISSECADIQKIYNKLGHNKSFWTGPSNTYHMWSKDSKTVRLAVRDTFSVFGPKGLILTASPTSHSIMPWKNTLAMIDEWKHLRYATKLDIPLDANAVGE